MKAAGHVFVLTAHLGNWELAGRLLADRFGRRVHVVVAPEIDPEVERFLRPPDDTLRFVSRRGPADVLGLVAALRRREIVAVQGDRAFGSQTQRVPFFGADASFPLGPFVLARASGAPIVPVFCVLTDDLRYRVELMTPIRVARDGEADGVARWAGDLEAVVARHPEQWFNFFDAWSDVSSG